MATINNPIFTVTGMPVKRIESIGHQQGIIIQIYLNVLYFIFAVSHTVGHTVDDAQQKMSLFRITAPRGIGIIMNKILGKIIIPVLPEHMNDPFPFIFQYLYIHRHFLMQQSVIGVPQNQLY